MKNENFRNYNVCSKVTASQKKLYTELARKEGLSLSEWIGSKLDISIEKLNLFETKKIEMKNEIQNKFAERERYITYQKKDNVKETMPEKIIEVKPRIKNPNSLLNNELNQYKSAANSFNSIGIIALIGSVLLKNQ